MFARGAEPPGAPAIDGCSRGSGFRSFVLVMDPPVAVLVFWAACLLAVLRAASLGVVRVRLARDSSSLTPTVEPANHNHPPISTTMDPTNPHPSNHNQAAALCVDCTY
jgi:hypothetical protein